MRKLILILVALVLSGGQALAFSRPPQQRWQQRAVPDSNNGLFTLIRDAKATVDLAGSAGPGGDAEYTDTFSFAIRQTVSLPQLRNPVRLAYCNDADLLSISLEQSINELFRDWIAPLSSALVATTYYQSRDVSCTFTSLIGYKGSPKLQETFLTALNSTDPVDKLCKLLPSYCSGQFSADAGYVLLAATAVANLSYPVTDFKCNSLTFQQQLDHFNPYQKTRFSQKYYVCDDAWPSDDPTEQELQGHIIVYLGNEAPLGLPQQPIVFENARWMKALVIIIEHRYYGESLPFPDMSSENLKWLTVEQAVEDTADILAAVRTKYAVPAAVPVVVIGASYGGMLAVYHRITKPDIFAAAVSSSGPVYYAMGNQLWTQTGQNLHTIAAYAANTFYGSTACSTILRKGISRVISMGKTKSGRMTLQKLFKLCDDSPLETPEAALNLALHIQNSMYWFTMYNGQAVSIIGGVELLCDVLLTAAAAAAAPPTGPTVGGGSGSSSTGQSSQQQQQQQEGRVELRALVALHAYMSSWGSDWCYTLNPSTLFITGDQLAYEYSTCAQGAGGTTYMLTSQGWQNTYAPKVYVSQEAVLADCNAVFGPFLPSFRNPWFIRDVQWQMLQVQGLVFTNGDTDPVAGGSLMSDWDLYSPGARPAAEVLSGSSGISGISSTISGSSSSGSGSGSSSSKRNSTSRSTNVTSTRQRKTGSQHPYMPGSGSGTPRPVKPPAEGPVDIAYVVYRNASHCSDTNAENWGLPVEPPAWQQQRQLAMQYAVLFMNRGRPAFNSTQNGKIGKHKY